MGRVWGTEITIYHFTLKARMGAQGMNDHKSYNPVWSSVFRSIWLLINSYAGISGLISQSFMQLLQPRLTFNEKAPPAALKH